MALETTEPQLFVDKDYSQLYQDSVTEHRRQLEAHTVKQLLEFMARNSSLLEYRRCPEE